MRGGARIGLCALTFVFACNADAPAGMCTLAPGASDRYVPGSVHRGNQGFIEYRAGDAPIVIGVPHGGALEPATLPDRPVTTFGRDAFSAEYADETIGHLERVHGWRPHVIISRLHRDKLDPNREIKEAAQGNRTAEQAWREYHGFIDAAKAWIVGHCGAGHYVDLHTHAHAEAWVEIGHLLDGEDLARSDAELDAPAFVAKSSLRAIASRAEKSLSELVRGPDSLGGLLSAQVVRAVPSARHPHPGAATFFFGGYSVTRHGSRSGGAVDASLIEAHISLVRDPLLRSSFARKLADALHRFVRRTYAPSTR